MKGFLACAFFHILCFFLYTHFCIALRTSKICEDTRKTHFVCICRNLIIICAFATTSAHLPLPTSNIPTPSTPTKRTAQHTHVHTHTHNKHNPKNPKQTTNNGQNPPRSQSRPQRRSHHPPPSHPRPLLPLTHTHTTTIITIVTMAPPLLERALRTSRLTALAHRAGSAGIGTSAAGVLGL